MIYINHEKKAIFIHIPKTGGSYIGPTLVKYYGFVSFLDLIHQRRPDHKFVCKTYSLPLVLTGDKTYDESFFNKVLGILVYCKTSLYLNEQMNMNEEKWNNYTKFCFIRHPYDRAVSGWKHINAILTKCNTLNEYLNVNPINVSDIEYGHIFMSQSKHIEDINGECGVNIIGRFENLEEDFVNILKNIGFKNIVHKNKKVNVSNSDGYKYLNLTINEIIKLNKLFKDDFSNFHYKKLNL